MRDISIKHFGPIDEVNVNLGNLTILIGEQASGKSLFLQLLKLVLDKEHVLNILDGYNYVLGSNYNNILNLYLGEGMSDLWTDHSSVCYDGMDFSRDNLKHSEDVTSGSSVHEKLFYIPAQRILSISDGRPKNFMEFDTSTPYNLRFFSETLRLFFQYEINGDNILYPVGEKLKSMFNVSFDESIFHGGKVVIDKSSGQKKMRMHIANASLPFMTWSAGQKEFMPLLMAFYHLASDYINTSGRQKYQYVVIEEPEMGLHPQAIIDVIMQVVNFMAEGYKIIISTHSPVFVEFAWAFNLIRSVTDDTKRVSALAELLGISDKPEIYGVLSSISDKLINTYYFARTAKGVRSTDISTLDTFSDNTDISEWGGLSRFSTRAAEVVSKYISE